MDQETYDYLHGKIMPSVAATTSRGWVAVVSVRPGVEVGTNKLLPFAALKIIPGALDALQGFAMQVAYSRGAA